MSKAFDFEQHRSRSFEQYAAVRERYVRYARTIESILKTVLREIPTHNISARAKDLDRFADKAAKPHPDNPLVPRYPDPMAQIEDLAGARVIAYVVRTLSQIEQVVHREFDVVERSDKGQQLIEKALVGYRSIHFIVQMKPERVKLPEYQEFAGLRAEVQIRTILQHAWAEIEHDMRYKPTAEPNMELRQRFTALAGLIEVGDREFDQIYEIDDRRRKALRDLAQIKDEIPEPADNGKSSKIPSEPALPNVKESDDVVGSSAAGQKLQPKELMAQERYADSILAYNDLIARQPKQFAHYLGRAKARFLSGDVAGALADIAEADRLSPNHPFISRVRDLIEGRATDSRPANDSSLAVRQGHTALRDGDAAEALTKYAEAEVLGFSPVFSIFNRAMARFVEKKFDLTRRTLDRIAPHKGSVMEFNINVLRSLCYLAEGGDQKAGVDVVRTLLDRIKSTVDYKYNARSPLPDLEMGARKTFSETEWKRISPAFEVLKTSA